VKRVKYNPKQRKLFLFMEMKEPEKKDEQSLDEFLAISHPPPLPWKGHDCLDEIVDVMTKLEGERVLVCPFCSADVEPCDQPEVAKPKGEVVFESKRENIPVFCYCPECSRLFFIYELIKDKHFRRVSRSDANKDFLVYAQLDDTT